MRNLYIGVIVVLVVLGLAYLGSVYYVGGQVEAAVQDYETLFTESDEVIVHRFDYDKGFQSGQLHYDLEWSPPAGSLTGIYAALLPELDADQFRLTGTADIRHGPWVGGDNWLALARLDINLPMPDEMRQALPQYPGSTPALSIASVFCFDGLLQSRLRVPDYDGSLVIEGTAVALMLEGLQGMLVMEEGRTSASLSLGQFALLDTMGTFSIDDVNFDLTVQGDAPDLDIAFGLNQIELRVTDIPMSFRLESMNFSGDSSRLQPGLWLGESDGGIARIIVEQANFGLEIVDTRLTSNTGLDDAGLMYAETTTTMGRLNLGNSGVDQLTLGLAYNNLDTEAYAGIMQLYTDLSADPQNYESLMDGLMGIFNDFLDDGPTISIAPVSVSLVDSGDAAMSATLGYNGPVPVEEASEQELLNGVTVTGELNVSTAAARKMIEIFLTSSDSSLSGAQLTEAIEQNYSQMISALIDSGFFSVTDAAITSTLQVANGIVTANGVEAMNLSDLMGLVDDQFGGPEVVMPPDEPPVFSSEAMYENVALESGFTNTPYLVEVVAGGENTAQSILGADCPGNVTSQQPDVTLSFTTSGNSGLYVYAESEGDTTLIVLTPDGWYCDDDSHGDFNPGVSVATPVTGDYLIWVGTYDGGLVDATLGIAEDL